MTKPNHPSGNPLKTKKFKKLFEVGQVEHPIICGLGTQTKFQAFTKLEQNLETCQLIEESVCL